MTNPTLPGPPAKGGTATATRPVAAWHVDAGAGEARPLDPGAVAPVAELLRGNAAAGAADRATWVRLADVAALHDAAAGLGPDAHAGAGHPDTPRSRHPLAVVKRVADDWLLVVTPTAWYTPDDRQVHTGRFATLVGPGVVLTAEDGGAGVHDEMLDRLQAPGAPRGGAVRRVTAAAVTAVVSGASAVELELGDAVASTERLVFEQRRADPVQRIYDLKREITEARRALLPVTAELPELLDPDVPDHLGVDRRVLERLVSTVERIDRHLDAHDDLLSDMLQVHMSQVSVRQNEDMRKISAWAAILVYPTIVAGVYGMNFAHMPELAWTLGYPMALALMAVGCVVLYRVFRRAGWL
ncbi:CorA family divalent cation transporter [Cellulosimicrobium sp. PMB13]|uniref:CorA family divalent cation transporter n=1 Tax=Cellulosimicrobium sp. PMB13 TaxID=3120158 RepID=UPI003F4CAC61